MVKAKLVQQATMSMQSCRRHSQQWLLSIDSRESLTSKVWQTSPEVMQAMKAEALLPKVGQEALSSNLDSESFKRQPGFACARLQKPISLYLPLKKWGRKPCNSLMQAGFVTSSTSLVHKPARGRGSCSRRAS
eukprot:TRINITY_DN12618_c0_g1_i1.p1 TRINITY_DN12618_c0_g1~~TRINITY_DN12618_c0_g1_i1.p1  ORF type:complete len:133 (-),score=5.83 TRINITY_DN12618_c0_g1_i1:406-804(-)